MSNWWVYLLQYWECIEEFFNLRNLPLKILLWFHNFSSSKCDIFLKSSKKLLWTCSFRTFFPTNCWIFATKKNIDPIQYLLWSIWLIIWESLPKFKIYFCINSLSLAHHKNILKKTLGIPKIETLTYYFIIWNLDYYNSNNFLPKKIALYHSQFPSPPFLWTGSKFSQINKSLSGRPIFHLDKFSQFHQICPGSS